MTIPNPLVNTGLIAHRGASKFRPENTISALDYAAQCGAQWVETDVQCTADDQLVIIHDRDVDRTTDGNGFVALSDGADLLQLDAGSWMGPAFSGLRIPTLAQYLSRVQHHGLNLQLEFKERTGREEHLVDLVCDEVARAWRFDGQSKLFFSGFSERCIRRAAKRMPDVPRALALGFLPKNPMQIAEENDISIMHVQDRFLRPADLEVMQTCQLEFGVATVNDADRARVLLANGAQHILSDDPNLLD